MTKNGDKITVREVYELVDKKVGEVYDSIQRLENQFQALEAGRLSHLETTIAELQGRIFAVVAVITFIISTGVAVLSLILRK